MIVELPRVMLVCGFGHGATAESEYPTSERASLSGCVTAPHKLARSGVWVVHLSALPAAIQYLALGLHLREPASGVTDPWVLCNAHTCMLWQDSVDEAECPGTLRLD